MGKLSDLRKSYGNSPEISGVPKKKTPLHLFLGEVEGGGGGLFLRVCQAISPNGDSSKSNP